MSYRKPRRWHFRDPKFKNVLVEHAPDPLTNFFPCVHLQISPYAADYRYLYIAYEINALQGWKKRLEGVGGGGGVDFKNCSCQREMQFSRAIIFGGERVQFWYTTPFGTPTPRPPPPGRNKRSVPKVASRYRAFSSSCDLFIRIVLNFHFEFKVLTDGNKRSEMFIWSVTICLFKYDMYSCKLMFIRLSWIYSLPINLTLSPVILSAS